jgi:hypothetical protein
MMDTTQGAMLWEGSSPVPASLTTVFFGQIDNGTDQNRLLWYHENGSASELFTVYDTNVVQATLPNLGVRAVNQPVKFATAWKVNDFAAISSQGNNAGTDTSGTVPTGLANLRLGNATSGTPAPPAPMYISRMALYRTRLPNAT